MSQLFRGVHTTHAVHACMGQVVDTVESFIIRVDIVHYCHEHGLFEVVHQGSAAHIVASALQGLGLMPNAVVPQLSMACSMYCLYCGDRGGQL